MTIKLAHQSLIALLAAAALALGAGHSGASADPQDGSRSEPAVASKVASATSDSMPAAARGTANAGDLEYHSASGEGQFTAGGHLVGGTL